MLSFGYEAELLAWRMGLCQADRLGFSIFIAKEDSSFAIEWAWGSSRPPWLLMDIAEQMMELGLKLNVSYVLIKRLTP